MFYTVAPREQSGRMSLDRFDRQIKAAVIACLELLDDSEVEKIYCEFHDDYVIKRKIDNLSKYEFVQVKTNDKKELWSLNPLFGFNTRKPAGNQDPESIKNSFVGKMISHLVTFGDECNEVKFQTNSEIDSFVNELMEAIRKGDKDNKWLKSILKNFNKAFVVNSEYTENEIINSLKRIVIEADVSYIKRDDPSYDAIARDKIFEFSEIELKYFEVREILRKLEHLVNEKSKGEINVLNEQEIDKKAAVCLDDLLRVLAISKDAYKILKDGGDKNAIKSASIIQRTLEGAGVNETTISEISRCKNEWDLWVREIRLDFLDIELIDEIIQEELSNIINFQGILKLSELKSAVSKSKIRLKDNNLLFNLDDKELLGAFFSQIVRMKS